MNKQIALAAALAVAMMLTCVVVAEDSDAADPVSDGFGGYIDADSTKGARFTWTYNGTDTLTFTFNGGDNATMPNQGADGTLEGDWSAYSGSVTKVVFVDVTNIGGHLLAGFTNLSEIEVTSSDSSPIAIETIGNYAFAGCTSLKNASAVIGDGLVEISGNAFTGSGLSGDLIIPDTVTTIGKSAFQNTDIESVVIGENIASIDNNAFADCAELETVEFTGDSLPENALGNTPFKTNPKFKVPAGSESSYAAVLADAVDGTPSVNDFVAQIGDEQYVSLPVAINAAENGQTIELIDNITTDKTLEIDKSITIDGNGQYGITSGSNVVVSILIETDNVTVGLKNMDITNTYPSASDGNNPTSVVRILAADGSTLNVEGCTFSTVSTNARGIDARGSMEPQNPSTIVSDVTINLIGFTYKSDTAQRAVGFYGAKDSKISISGDSDILVNYYAINLASYTNNITVEVENSKIQAWAVLNSYAVESSFKFTNSELIGYNDFSYDAEGWNNFAILVMDGGSYSGMEPGTASKGNTMTVEGCTLTAQTESGNNQAIIAYQYGGQQNSVVMNDCTIKTVGNLGDGSPLEPNIYINATGSKLTIDGMEIVIPETGDDESVTVPFDPVAQIGDVGYAILEDAIDAAMNGTDKTVLLISDITAGTWNQIWNIQGITIDGQGHTISMTAIESLENHDAVLHSAGDNTFKNMTIDMSGITAASKAQGYKGITAVGGDRRLRNPRRRNRCCERECHHHGVRVHRFRLRHRQPAREGY